MPNLLYTYILNIYDLVWLGFMAYQPLFFLCIWHISHCRLFNAKPSLYICINMICLHILSDNILKFDWVVFCWVFCFFACLIFCFCTQLNQFTYGYITVPIWHQSFLSPQFEGYFIFKWVISNFFCISTQFNSIWPFQMIPSQSELTLEQCQWRGTPHSPNLQGWSLAIRLLNIISRTGKNEPAT